MGLYKKEGLSYPSCTVCPVDDLSVHTYSDWVLPNIYYQKDFVCVKASVLKEGVEPSRTNVHRILSTACLPIPPSEQYTYISNNLCKDSNNKWQKQ